MKYTTNYDIPNLSQYKNPRCSFEHNENQVVLNKDLSVGIDLGVKDLAIVNHLNKPIKNINKTVKVKKLKKKLKRLQHQVSRKYEANVVI